MNEPELASGDSGESVEQLQTRLHALGRYHGALDGHYGEQTAAAVSEFQHEKGLTADGSVGPLTWAAIAAAETAAGLHGHAPAADGHLAVGDLSEDQQWRWDGERWEATGAHAEVAIAHAEPGSHEHKSADGQWLWDGTKWQPVV